MADVHLVRHGRPILGEGRRPDWSLDPHHLGEIDRLRESGVLPDRAGWFTSPERRAVETAARLGHPEAVIIQDFREQERPDEFVDEFPVVVERSLVFPDEPALLGWETVASVANRVLRALEAIEAGDKPLVLVGTRTGLGHAGWATNRSRPGSRGLGRASHAGSLLDRL